MSNQVYANAVILNPKFANQRLDLLEAGVFPGLGSAGKMAYYDISGQLNDAQISITGVENDLTFDTNTTIFVDNLESTASGVLNIGDVATTNEINIFSLDAANIDADAVLIGHEGGVVNIVETTRTPHVVTLDVESETSLDLGISTLGAFTLGRVGSTVNITSGSSLTVDSISPGALASANLFINTPFITMGQGGGVLQLGGGLGFALSGPPSINYYSQDSIFAATVSGPFAPAVTALYSLQRINNVCTLILKWTLGSIVATINAPMSVTPVLTAAFIPVTVQAFACQVRGPTAFYELGTIAINTIGQITIYPSAAGQFVIGNNCNFDTICIQYSML